MDGLNNVPQPLRYIDLFCGIGGFRIGLEQCIRDQGYTATCVFSSDHDPDAQHTYRANFGTCPAGDITDIDEESIPQHDLLLAGFPCQPFSICGSQKGFADARGTLFFDIARILRAKRPALFILENVKMLVRHQGGQTLQRMLQILETDLGYTVSYKVLNALDFGLPQKRERVFLVGFRDRGRMCWDFPYQPMQSLRTILEPYPSDFYTASDHIQRNRQIRYTGEQGHEPTIWHENKAGHISAYPFSCALRAGASYNYLLVNGQRRLTEREMLRLQGFPEDFQIVCGYHAMRRLVGNSVAVPCVRAVVGAALAGIAQSQATYTQHRLLEDRCAYH
ncbi:MAG: DNA (cytosine-5-)-methyltransferase [Chloroflexaceae bacterium]|nr:DNA (cytosine-5-)-methyltransferase [Chloroflexaceae bacterium]